MVFSSLFFIFFFLPCSLFVNFLVSKNIRAQNFSLLLFSLLFYYWGEQNHIVVMLSCIMVNYFLGIMIGTANCLIWKRISVILSILISLGLLAYFKYYNFFLKTSNQVFNLGVDHVAEIALPLGISFYTFHALSYTIDVYWGKVKPEKNIVNFFCYVSLFPQLVAGPIVRYRDIGHAFYHRYTSRVGFRNGILRFSFGIAKKILIANNVAVVSDQIFALPYANLSTSVAWLGAFSALLQIYFDFSGYSDMAIGLGLMFGFKYKENFFFPLASSSMQDFWRRWHISLTSWFRDYLYIPLGGSQKSKFRTYFNLLTMFFLSGLWHGANMTFILWGCYHGLFLLIEQNRLVYVAIHKAPKIFCNIYVWFVCVISMVLFKCDTVQEAFHFIKMMFIYQSATMPKILTFLNSLFLISAIIGFILAIGMSDYIKKQLIQFNSYRLLQGYKVLRIYIALIVLLISIMALTTNAYNPFIYFRF